MRSMNASWDRVKPRSWMRHRPFVGMLLLLMALSVVVRSPLPVSATETSFSTGAEAFAEETKQSAPPPDFAAMQQECRQQEEGAGDPQRTIPRQG